MVVVKHRGRQPPSYDVYGCTECYDGKPRIRNGEYVNCSCGAAPNSNLARLYRMPDWPRVPVVWERV